MTSSTQTLEQLQTENTRLQEKISYLEERIGWFERQIFGQRAEKFVDNNNEEQLLLDGFGTLNSQKTSQKQTMATHERNKSSRKGEDKITLPANLPTETQTIDLPEDQKKMF